MQAPDEQKNNVHCENQSPENQPTPAIGADRRPDDHTPPSEETQQHPHEGARTASYTIGGRFTVSRVKSPEPERHVRFASKVSFIGSSEEDGDPKESSSERRPRERRNSKWDLLRKDLSK